MTKFEVGDMVCTFDGRSPDMEVKRIDPNCIVCTWTDSDGDEQESKFNAWELKIVKMKGSDDA